MKTMKNFAAQQLTKKQMNEVKGGKVAILCPILGAGGKPINYICASGETFDDAAQEVARQANEAKVNTGECEFL